uniref:Uncharacterized protein n=1 Tax=viral metagenome TaxID=1070528 RepID=A0A6M3K319_9ZZZZ
MALYSNSLAVIRQYLSSTIGDLITGTFDSGDTNHAVDTMLRKDEDYYNKYGYECYIYSGTNIGEAREVSDWQLGTHTLTFDPGFTDSVDTTSLFELHHRFTADEYLKAINMAIESIAGKYLIDLKDETTITLVADTYEYELPLSFLYLYSVITEDAVDTNVYNEEDEIDPRDWDIIKAYPPKLKLNERQYSITAGKDLRLEGQGTQAKVTSDTDVIYIPPDWLVQKAITFLPKGKIMSNKLDTTYQQALALSVKEPRAWPNPTAKRIVE